MIDSVHRNTPSLTTYDGRRLTVRQTEFYRADPGAEARPYVSAQQYDVQGRPQASRDPRLFERHLELPDLQPNLRTVHNLRGLALASHSVDAGESTYLWAESGVLAQRWDARSTHWRMEYDAFLRPVTVHEHVSTTVSRVSERYSYACSDAQSAANNLCGQMTRVDDDAGSQRIMACSLLRAIMLDERRMLTDVQLPDWPEPVAERDALLESGPGAVTQRTHDATGAAIATTDARGHVQRMHFGVAGQLSQVMLTVKDAEEQVLLRDIQYSAVGHVQSQTAGNGVISHYGYGVLDQRLQTLKTRRAGNDLLQSLTYSRDPVGNVLRISDEAQPVRYGANQRISPVNDYVYDSLYQLISASGRETANASNGPDLPCGLPLPIDGQWLNYIEHYSYDAANNLVQLRHEGNQAYTRSFDIEATSNRALLRQNDDIPPDFAHEFDACGNLQRLAAGQSLVWDARNRLARFTAVSRKDAQDDAEHYVYDNLGERVRKIATSVTRSTRITREVRYLPGLELRSDSASNEQLEVIVVQAGRCAVRCLHWVSGRPADIQNDQLRYSVDDHLGSSTLELDANARIISHEGYYPFGGTAWLAVRAEIEAKYKVVRYSGKERDASGLYYYGIRYYAPWLMRWINPDPQGCIDGLNLYRMARNDPLNRIDSGGGQSFDVEVWMAIAAAIVVGMIGGAVLMRSYQHRSSNDSYFEKLALKEKFIEDSSARYHLYVGESQALGQFMTKHRLTPSQMAFKYNEDTTELIAFGISNGRQHDYITNNFNHPHLAQLSAGLGIPSIQITNAFAVEALERRRGSLPAASSTMSTVTNFTADMSTGEKDSYRVGKGSTKRRVADSQVSAGNSGAAGLPSTSNARVKREAVLGDYFSSTSFLKSQKKFGDGLGEIVERAVERYVIFGEGNPHILKGGKKTTPEMSLNLPELGSARQGKWRLLLTRPGNTGPWTPHRIGDTH